MNVLKFLIKTGDKKAVNLSNHVLSEPPFKRKRKKLYSLLIVFAIIIISVVLFLAYGRDPTVIAQFQKYGYLGAFLISLIGNASVFLFMGTVLPVLVSIGGIIYPASGLLGLIGVGLAGGLGAGIGEIAGYLIGYSGRRVIEENEKYERLASRIKTKGAIAVFFLSLFPFVFDVVAIAAGALRIPLWQFVIACWAGRTILYVVAVVVVILGWDALVPF